MIPEGQGVTHCILVPGVIVTFLVTVNKYLTCQGVTQGRESYSSSGLKAYRPLRQGRHGDWAWLRGSGSMRLLIHTSDQEAEGRILTLLSAFHLKL